MVQPFIFKLAKKFWPKSRFLMRKKALTDYKCNRTFTEAFVRDLKAMKSEFAQEPTHENLSNIEQKYGLDLVRCFHENSKKHVLYNIVYTLIIEHLTVNTGCKSTLLYIFLLHFFFTSQINDITYINITIEDLERINTIQNPFFVFYLSDLKRKDAFDVHFHPNDFFLRTITAEVDDIEQSMENILT